MNSYKSYNVQSTVWFKVLLLYGLFFNQSSSAQNTQSLSVLLEVVTVSDPPLITINWQRDPDATNLYIYRKPQSSTSWGSPIAELDASDTTFTDSLVERGKIYEYRVSKITNKLTGFGYVLAGIEVPEIEKRGRLILVIDSTIIDSLDEEIRRLQQDLEGDGWKVRTILVDREASAQYVKSRIFAAYVEQASGTRAVFLLGHVPVPYSGEIGPDGHPDHIGAWPADGYYGDINGSWTDQFVNNTSASSARNRNIPGDGKLDQSSFPGAVDLMVGRVDLSNMPAFALSEIQLLRNYLDKDHAYRHRQVVVENKAIIDDHFGFFNGEAFAASAWKSFGPLVGRNNVMGADYFPYLSSNSAIWSYGCGGGSYTSAGGIGTTNDFAASDLQSVFTMLFGSYFGDWDSQNNFLRAPLAQGKTLTNAWSGRPHWVFHQMGLGEPVGYCALISQNNPATYWANYGARFVHIALMGDPTLRMYMVDPPGDVIATRQPQGAMITWTASGDKVVGYHVYARHETQQEFERMNDEVILEEEFFYPLPV